MTKENLWQVIVGMVVAALCTMTFNMGAFALPGPVSNRPQVRSTKTPKAIMKNRSFGKTLYR